MDSLYHYPYEVKMLYLLLFGVFIVLAPGASLLVLKMNKSISSLSLEVREERATPIAIMTFYCLGLKLNKSIYAINIAPLHARSFITLLLPPLPKILA